MVQKTRRIGIEGRKKIKVKYINWGIIIYTLQYYYDFISNNKMIQIYLKKKKNVFIMISILMVTCW